MRKESEGELWEREKKEREERDREKTRKNREKRERLKNKKTKAQKGGSAEGENVVEKKVSKIIKRADFGGVKDMNEQNDNTMAAMEEVGIVIHDDD